MAAVIAPPSPPSSTAKTVAVLRAMATEVDDVIRAADLGEFLARDVRLTPREQRGQLVGSTGELRLPDYIGALAPASRFAVVWSVAAADAAARNGISPRAAAGEMAKNAPSLKILG